MASVHPSDVIQKVVCGVRNAFFRFRGLGVRQRMLLPEAGGCRGRARSPRPALRGLGRAGRTVPPPNSPSELPPGNPCPKSSRCSPWLTLPPEAGQGLAPGSARTDRRLRAQPRTEQGATHSVGVSGETKQPRSRHGRAEQRKCGPGKAAPWSSPRAGGGGAAGRGGSAGRGPALVGFCRRPAGRDGEGAPQPETRARVAGPHPDAEGEAEVPWNCQQLREERGGTGEQHRDAGAAGGQRQ